MITLREALQEYIDLRRRLGYKMHCEGLLLPRFVNFMEEHHAEHISVRLTVEWAQCASVQPAEWARRLCFVRGFARGLIGLLSVTGMRLSEALNLKLADVDLEQAVLTIRGAKFGQWRLVPIHPSASAVLADYLTRREQFFHHPVSTYVFVSRRGTRLDGGHVHRTFYTLSRSTGLRAVGASKGPRLHDFRHRFAVQTLIRWYQTHKDPGREMPLLSTYLGHVCVACTYWYLSGNPELMAQAMARLERRWGASS